MNTKAIQQLADATLDKYRSSIPRKAFEEFVKDIIAGENRATAFRYEAAATASRTIAKSRKAGTPSRRAARLPKLPASRSASVWPTAAMTS